MNKTFINLLTGSAVLTTCLWPTSAPAQEAQSEGIKQSVVFLEQLVGAWSLVLEKWDNDPSSEQWLAARKACQTPLTDPSPRAIADADAQLPPKSMLSGDLIYYRGPGGLQQFITATGDIRLFPNLRVGTSKKGTPVYEISGGGDGGDDDGGDGNQLVLAIGKIQAGEQQEIILVQDGSLYLSCQK